MLFGGRVSGFGSHALHLYLYVVVQRGWVP